MSEQKVCSGCKKNFEGTLSCPTCIKLGLEPSYFCSQECFKLNWNTHKLAHKGPVDEDEKYLRVFNGYKFTGELRPAGITPQKKVPSNIKKPDYADSSIPHSELDSKNSNNRTIRALSKEEIQNMRESCRIGREALDVAHRMVNVGVTCDEIDQAVHDFIVSKNAYPSPLNYHKFPKSCCTSVNEVICHGIPDKRPLQDGDIVNVDISTYYKGMHADLNETFFVGNVDENGRKLVKGAYECLAAAIQICRPGVMYREIGNVIDKIAKKYQLSITKNYCGHGVNDLFHTVPNIPHYAKNKAIGIMKPGHTFTIEPMINEGTWKDSLWPDEWTAVTQDGKRSAQFEHTLLITEDGCEVLTGRLPSSPPHDFEVPEEYIKTNI